MAKKKNTKPSASVPSKQRFADIIHSIGYRFSLHQVFTDFLTMAICACTQNMATGKSWYEDEYLSVIDKYKDSELRHEFPKAFASLIMEMEERFDSSLGNDVLGDFFERHISNGRNGQYFTPFPICQFMTSITNENTYEKKEKPLRILDPACGSGRMLVASFKVNSYGNEYYGIDIDPICVKITALNLFLNGIWHSEAMCANSLSPSDFVISYRISFLPLGIFKIEDKEKSELWHLHHNSFVKDNKPPAGSMIQLDSRPFSERKKDNSAQLDLF
jgi:type I restriction-modification system DNA methylase subunit